MTSAYLCIRTLSFSLSPSLSLITYWGRERRLQVRGRVACHVILDHGIGLPCEVDDSEHQGVDVADFEVLQ